MLSQLSSISSEQRPCIWRPYALVSLILLIIFLAWDSTVWDMQLATIWGDPNGFALRDHWWMAQIMHSGAMGWLLMAVCIGFILGISQQMRGAHFMSHTLWTAWLCWTVGWLSHLLFSAISRKIAS